MASPNAKNDQLRYLAGLKQLRMFDLGNNTNVTNDTVDKLENALPWTEIIQNEGIEWV